MLSTRINNRFSDAEMQIVRETDLPELLTHLGYQVRQIGRYHTTAEMDSLRIKDRRTWFRYSQNIGGDAITFLQQFHGKNFPEAVEYLLNFQGKARDSPVKTMPFEKRDEPPKAFTLPPRNEDDRRVFAYLRKRGIAPQVIRQFMNSGLLYEDAIHHNCVFVGRDSIGQAKYAGLRGTYDRDGKGLKKYLQAHPKIRRIVLCLDADAPGRETTRRLKEQYAEQGYAVTVEEPRSGKDWNEYLQKRRSPERGR